MNKTVILFVKKRRETGLYAKKVDENYLNSL